MGYHTKPLIILGSVLSTHTNGLLTLCLCIGKGLRFEFWYMISRRFLEKKKKKKKKKEKKKDRILRLQTG